MTDLPINPVLKDIQAALKRMQRVKFVEARNEFADNCYPLLETMYEQMDERITDLEHAVSQIIEQTESVLQPDMSVALINLIQMGGQCAEIAKETNPELAAAYHTAAQAMVEAIQDVTVVVEDDEEEEEEEGEEGETEGATSEQPGEGATAPAPAPAEVK